MRVRSASSSWALKLSSSPLAAMVAPTAASRALWASRTARSTARFCFATFSISASVRMISTFGAPSGAETPFGKSFTESLGRSPIFPWNGWSGIGRIVRLSPASC